MGLVDIRYNLQIDTNIHGPFFCIRLPQRKNSLYVSLNPSLTLLNFLNMAADHIT